MLKLGKVSTIAYASESIKQTPINPSPSGTMFRTGLVSYSEEVEMVQVPVKTERRDVMRSLRVSELPG